MRLVAGRNAVVAKCCVAIFIRMLPGSRNTGRGRPGPKPEKQVVVAVVVVKLKKNETT